MDFDWKSAVRTVAPALATALGTPLAGTATKILTDLLLGESAESTDEALAQAMQTATPDQLLALKQADQKFQHDMAKLQVDLEQIASTDRADARKREAATGDNVTPRLLAIGITGGFFGVLAWLLTSGLPMEGGDALLVMLGSLGTAWAGVVSYYFGSSSGSTYKSGLLAQVEAKK